LILADRVAPENRLSLETGIPLLNFNKGLIRRGLAMAKPNKKMKSSKVYLTADREVICILDKIMRKYYLPGYDETTLIKSHSSSCFKLQ